MSDEVLCIPVLPSLDLDETLSFYRDVLRFGLIYKDETRLIVRRGSMELHFWPVDDRRLCENASCYIRGGGIDGLYEEFRTAEVPGLSGFEVRPWDMKEFYIHDPHGNLLTFGRIPQEEAI
ncbi:bleomycin resistance protein [Roseibium litorale]|uniref:Bleomycin resistance protein n=1 Tax=Roseibium litorale TaxID=2803841 RepID=A0ABR9CHE6_9HYPH|nr:VOC family protein [Roseibium litorale]MBD8890270.1 VOC family protein [Roseibium litorale]